MDGEKKYLNYNGQRIAYRQFGNADAPAIVMFMGLGLSSGAWPMPLLSFLLQEGFQIILPDNRDCGDSFRFPTGRIVTEREVSKAIIRAIAFLPVHGFYTLEDMAFDVENVLNELRIRRAHIVGFSMGGMIAQVLATQCPNRIASLISISSACGNPKTGLGNFRAIKSLLSYPKTKKKELCRRYFETLFTTLAGERYKPNGEELKSLMETVEKTNYDIEGAYRQIFAILTSGNRTKQLRRIYVPTLVIHGTDDPLIPLAAGREVAELIPNAKIESIQGMGHQLPETLMPHMGKLIARHFHANPV